jgi:polycomb group RING finger protein 5
MIATHPLKTEVRFDRVMQNLVDKLLPQFAEEEEELRKKIAAQYGGGDAAPKRAASEATDGQPATKRFKFGDENLGSEKLMIFELRPYVPPVLPSAAASAASSHPTPLPPLPLPFVKTSAKITVKSLRKFICERLSLPPATQLDVQCGGEVLGQDHSVEFVWKTRWVSLHPNQHLVLTYRIQAHAV